MSINLPAPLVPPDVDVRNLDGFMLNVERLMASELVALSSHEVVAAALFLWCRAWKQIPAASLPDDDRVIAAFARLPMSRFKKLKCEVLRGFIKCSDGRLYHGVLAAAAVASFGRKRTFQERREKDAERLREWRLKQPRNADETQSETQDETRFVREGEGREREREKEEERKMAPPPNGDGTHSSQLDEPEAVVVPTPEAELYRRAKEILGSGQGGLIGKLLKSRDGNVALARAALETASQKGNPRDYLGAIVNQPTGGRSSRDLVSGHSSRDM